MRARDADGEPDGHLERELGRPRSRSFRRPRSRARSCRSSARSRRGRSCPPRPRGSFRLGPRARGRRARRTSPRGRSARSRRRSSPARSREAEEVVRRDRDEAGGREGPEDSEREDRPGGAAENGASPMCRPPSKRITTSATTPMRSTSSIESASPSGSMAAASTAVTARKSAAFGSDDARPRAGSRARRGARPPRRAGRPGRSRRSRSRWNVESTAPCRPGRRLQSPYSVLTPNPRPISILAVGAMRALILFVCAIVAAVAARRLGGGRVRDAGAALARARPRLGGARDARRRARPAHHRHAPRHRPHAARPLRTIRLGPEADGRADRPEDGRSTEGRSSGSGCSAAAIGSSSAGRGSPSRRSAWRRSSLDGDPRWLGDDIGVLLARRSVDCVMALAAVPARADEPAAVRARLRRSRRPGRASR